jgi:hypothetical protein
MVGVSERCSASKRRNSVLMSMEFEFSLYGIQDSTVTFSFIFMIKANQDSRFLLVVSTTPAN